MDRAVAISRSLTLKMEHCHTWNIGYSDLRLNIVTNTGCYLLHKGLILRSLETKLLFL